MMKRKIIMIVAILIIATTTLFAGAVYGKANETCSGWWTMDILYSNNHNPKTWHTEYELIISFSNADIFKAYAEGYLDDDYVQKSVLPLNTYYISLDVSGAEPEPDPEPNND